MGRLVLQMQSTVDGFVSSHENSWQTWDWSGDPTWDDELLKVFNDTILSTSAILLSRPMIESGYLDHWETVADERGGDDRFRFAGHVARVPKYVVTSQPFDFEHEHTTVLVDPLEEAVTRLKTAAADPIISFGGTSFAAALLEFGLVDEIQLYVNPTATGRGDSLFRRRTHLEQLGAQDYACGVAVVRYATTTT